MMELKNVVGALLLRREGIRCNSNPTNEVGKAPTLVIITHTSYLQSPSARRIAKLLIFCSRSHCPRTSRSLNGSTSSMTMMVAVTTDLLAGFLITSSDLHYCSSWCQQWYEEPAK